MLEVELRTQGFKKFRSHYNGVCSACGRRFEAGETIMWKREGTRTITICSQCYKGGDQS